MAGGHHGHSHSSTHSHAEDAIHDHDHHHHDHGHAHAHAHDPLEGFSGEGIEGPKHGYDEAAFALLGDGETPGSSGEGHGHAHGMSDLLLPLLVLAGFMLFFVSERIVRGLAGERGGHSHTTPTPMVVAAATHRTTFPLERRTTTMCLLPVPLRRTDPSLTVARTAGDRSRLRAF